MTRETIDNCIAAINTAVIEFGRIDRSKLTHAEERTINATDAYIDNAIWRLEEAREILFGEQASNES